MRFRNALLGLLAAAATAGAVAEDGFDRLDDALSVAADNDQIRARLSGSLELEEYVFQQPAPGLIYSDGDSIFVPRLTLFLDAQLGGRVYAFAQARADNGFDPGDDGRRVRLDEYAVRVTPWANGAVNLQVGKFATIVGSWVPRHYAWDNPFVTAPLPYENLTGIFDAAAAPSADLLLKWSGVRPSAASAFFHEYQLPIIWGPSYATGAALTGVVGRFDYAVEFKNTSLAARPASWDPGQTQWQHPTVSSHLAYRPDEMWTLGVSASAGSYLTAAAQPTLAPGRTLAAYRETLLGADVGYAWHHLQFWAEAFAAHFAIPSVGEADTLAYYLETKYKFTPQFFGAVRWNQQVFGTVPDGANGAVRWGRDVWRIDLAPTYRLTPHVQFKLQVSLEHGAANGADYTRLVAGQFMVKF